MQIGDYQNIAVITISQGSYVNHWVYQADKINPAKKHGWDSIALYLSVLQQTLLYPESHRRNNGEDYHLYYIPLGNEMNIEKAKKLRCRNIPSGTSPGIRSRITSSGFCSGKRTIIRQKHRSSGKIISSTCNMRQVIISSIISNLLQNRSSIRKRPEN